MADIPESYRAPPDWSVCTKKSAGVKQYRDSEWLDPRIEIRSSPIGGRGMFALTPVSAGEALIIWGGVVFTRAEIDAGVVAEGSTVAIGEGVYLGSPAGTYDRERDDRGDFINHSCDPNVWMQDEVTSVARRDIRAGEELTMDYAMIREDDSRVARFDCRCASALCRGKVTGRDWRRPELQARYAGHFSPFINERIRRVSGGLP